MRQILADDECNDTYGRVRMYQILKLRNSNLHIPSERTIYRIMREIGINHTPNSEDLFKRNFKAEKPFEKAVTDITEIKASNGKLYATAIFDCYDLSVLGLSMDTNMKAELCAKTVDNAVRTYPALKGAIIHSDRGSQYTSGLYRSRLAAC